MSLFELSLFEHLDVSDARQSNNMTSNPLISYTATFWIFLIGILFVLFLIC